MALEDKNPRNSDDNDSEIRKKINELYEESELQSLLDNKRRARSISVGPTGGGILEFTMRNEWNSMFYIVNPVEAIEFMSQIAAAVGVEIAVRPRNDFASWRSWDTTLPASVHWMGAAPWQLSDEDRKQLTESKDEESQKKNSLPDMIDEQLKKENIKSEDCN